MKKQLFIFLLFLIPFHAAFSQESIVDKIAMETCEYLQSDEIKNIEPENRNGKLGIFIINLYNQYSDELLQEGIEINFSDGSNSGREFGEKVGMHMAKFCPEVLMSLAENSVDNIEEDSTYEIEGKLIDIQGQEFSIVTIKDEEGKFQKFLWLQNFIGSDQLIEISNNINKKQQVKVIYKNLECYSPQLKEYIIRKEIIEMIFLN